MSIATVVSILVLLWPLLTAAVTAAFTPLTQAQITAALGVGSAARAVSMWEHVVFVMAASGINSRAIMAYARAWLARNGGNPPGTGEGGSDPYRSAGGPATPPPLPSNPPAVPRIALALLAIALSSVGLASLVTACGSVTQYAPTPDQELGVVSYASAEGHCLELDASHADKVACVHAARCAAGRVDAATCDAGAVDAQPPGEVNQPLLDCLWSDGGTGAPTGCAWTSTSGTDHCVCPKDAGK